MCFRPPSFDDLMKKCPKCGSFNPPELTRCKNCGGDLPEASAPDPAGAPPAMGTPKAPGAPGAAPKAPGAPGAAPKSPGAPKAPGAPKPPAGA